MSAEDGTTVEKDRGETWLVIPRTADVEPEWRTEVQELFGELLESESEFVEYPTIVTTRPLDPVEVISSLTAFADSVSDDGVIIVGLGVPGRWPLPVIFRAASSDSGTDLLSVAGASGGQPIDPPHIEYLTVQDGDGVRVTRFDLDDDRVIWCTVSLALQSKGVDSVLTWRTTELDLLPLFSPQLDSLLTLVTEGTSS